MKDVIVRLYSIELENIKNVRYGKVAMPIFEVQSSYEIRAAILGIYGQNGSGKTAVIDAMYFLQKILAGESLDKEMSEYIENSSTTAKITTKYRLYNDEKMYDIHYTIVLKKAENQHVVLEQEILSSSSRNDHIKEKMKVFMDYTRRDGNIAFIPQKRHQEVISNHKNGRKESSNRAVELIVAKKLAIKSNCSFIFGEYSRVIFLEEYHNDFNEASMIIQSLFQFGSQELFVIRNTNSGVISANLLLPISFRYFEKGKDGSGIKGSIAISLHETTIVSSENVEMLEQVINQINMVLYTIIPGLKIGIEDYGVQLTNQGEPGQKIELFTQRDHIKIPIRMESAGIIKIISILNAIIQAFDDASIFLAIDELDAGVFEYLLGELLDVFGNHAKGQMIFTSHNLRALEMLNKKSILFSTTNPDNRYIHIQNVKNISNLRDEYLRSISLGGQKEEIYADTDKLKIARAFRKAGRDGKE
jgi:AAA15 family ATPase/GTPase